MNECGNFSRNITRQKEMHFMAPLRNSVMQFLGICLAFLVRVIIIMRYNIGHQSECIMWLVMLAVCVLLHLSLIDHLLPSVSGSAFCSVSLPLCFRVFLVWPVTILFYYWTNNALRWCDARDEHWAAQRPRGYLTEEFLINLFISAIPIAKAERWEALAIKLSSIVVLIQHQQPTSTTPSFPSVRTSEKLLFPVPLNNSLPHIPN